MARPFGGNWACAGIRRLIKSGATAEEIAQYLSTQPRFLKEVQKGIDGHRDIPGGDGAEQVAGNLSEALVEV